jgi:hypothetical protein
VIGSAVQGTVFQVLGHTTQGGGWYKVQGATLTGWISANSAFSRPGRFASYESTSFSVLYPAGWFSPVWGRLRVPFQGGENRYRDSPQPREAAFGQTGCGGFAERLTAGRGMRGHRLPLQLRDIASRPLPR